MPIPNPSPTSRRTALLALFGLATTSRMARAAAPGWPEQAFAQKTEDDTLKLLYGKPLEVPEIAENGAVVPISVSTSLPDVTGISILVPENPSVLAAAYKLGEGSMPSVGCRLKMAKTSKVVAVVESGGKLYGASREVKVTLGGCGG